MTTVWTAAHSWYYQDIPDEDITRVLADVEVRGIPGADVEVRGIPGAEVEVRGMPVTGAARSLPPSAAPVAEAAVGSLVEPLRGLGGDALATRTAGTFRCTITSL